MTYENSDLAKVFLPTRGKISGYLEKADRSDPKSRDVRPLMSLLLRITSNPRVSGHILTRKTALSSYSWEIEPVEDLDDAVLQDARVRLSGIVPRLLSMHTDTPLFGVSAVRLLWLVSGDAGLAPQIDKRFRPIEIERYDASTVGILGDAGTSVELITKEELRSDYLIDYDEAHDRGGVLRSIAIYAQLAYETVIEWSRLNARMKGVITGTIDAERLQRQASALGLQEAEIASVVSSLDDTLKNAGENNYLRTLSAVDIQLKSLVEAAAGGSYAAFLQELKSDMAIAILGQANTSELPSGGGSRAALQVLNLIRADIVLDDMTRTESLINHLCLLDYRTNYEPGATASPYRFRFRHDDGKDIESGARVLETVSRIEADIPLRRSEVYGLIGFSQPADGDETILLRSTPTVPGV